MTDDLRERFASHVSVDESTGCWLWTGYVDAHGYGRLSVRSLGQILRAHRLSYAIHRGPLDAALTIDHLCRNRRCVNPAHLDQVSNRANVLRGVGITAQNAMRDRCVHGHPYDAKSIGRNGLKHRRRCRVCARNWRSK